MDNVVVSTRYWCHICSRTVYLATGVELECPYCHNGFIEEMTTPNDHETRTDMDLGSDRILSTWAPILLDMMNNNQHQRRTSRSRFDSDEPNHDDGNDIDRGSGLQSYLGQGSGTDRSATILQLLQGVRAGLTSGTDSDREGERDTNRIVTIEPLNRTIILRGPTVNSSLLDFLGDYLMGRGLDLVLQHLAEIDPTRQGTPPTKKEAIEQLPTVEVKEGSACSVCLEDFEVGKEAKETPCQHRFHEKCILPWLELHSTCPVCRFQLPVDEPKLDIGGGNVNVGSGSSGGANNGEGGGGGGSIWNRTRFTIPWLIGGLFGNANSSSTSTSTSSSSAGNAVGRSSSSPTDRN